MECVALRSKCYRIVSVQNYSNTLLHTECLAKEMLKCKGVAKKVMHRDLRHAHYRECLQQERVFLAGWRQFRSKDHQIYTVDIRKKLYRITMTNVSYATMESIHYRMAIKVYGIM